MQPLTAPDRPRAARGRWIWRLSGIVTVAVLALFAAVGIIRAGTPPGGQRFSPVPTRTVAVTVPGTVTGLSVSSYGAPIQVSRGPVSQVKVVEAITASQSGMPSVTAKVSRGELTLAAPSCVTRGCEVGFTVTVPASLPVSAFSEGGNISVSEAAGADLDSGGGTVTATGISGSLTVTSDYGNITARDTGSADLDSGGGTVSASGINGSLTVTSDDGNITADATGTATLDSGGGTVSASGINGSLTVVSDDGNITAAGAAGANLTSGGGAVDVRAIDGPLNVTTDDGSLQVSGLSGALTADTGGGPVNASGVAAPTTRITSDYGSVSIGFTSAPQTVVVSTGGGSAVLAVPGGPYAVTDDAAGAPAAVSVPTSLTASRAISVSTDGGPLRITSAAG
jgi:hypothetical protein